jgi:N-ethylmaleimide reductase
MSESTNTQAALFAPYALGPLELENRMVMAPMTRSRANAERAVHDLQVEYYRQRAGAGLLITEATQVSPRGIGYPATPGLYTAAQEEGWRKVTTAVHEAGGLIYSQLFHVGRISHPSMQPGGALPVAPSAVKPAGKVYTDTGMQEFVTPRALEAEEIPGVIREFADAAAMARRAGFDGIEIHGANGYIVDQFLRDRTNRRTDAWGGSVENRVRFALEVTDGVVGVCGKDRVGFRISPNGSFNDMGDSDPRSLFLHLARELDRRGIAYLHLIEPVGGAMGAVPEDRRLLPDLRKAFRGTMMVNGGYGFEDGAEVIESGNADLVAYGVPYLANPDLHERFRRGAPRNEPDPDTFYGGGAKGYLDYPAL